jgi:hypothetical protein
MKVELKGFRELEKALAEELPKATARNVLRKSMIQSMKRIETGMAQRAPHDPQDRDGDGNHLNETMKTQAVKAKRQRGSAKFARSTGIEVMTGPAPVGKRARANAGWQEDGTVKMPPHAYARPTADAEGRRVVDEVIDVLRENIDKAKARVARKAARQAAKG